VVASMVKPADVCQRSWSNVLYMQNAAAGSMWGEPLGIVVLDLRSHRPRVMRAIIIAYD
jgi:hypothetical protein